MSRGFFTPRGTDWNQYGRGADDALVTLTQSPVAEATTFLANLEASFDSTSTAELELYGMTKLEFDATDTAVVNLTTDIFTFAGHGLSNADKVVYHNGGGTSIGGLTSGTAYFAVGVSGNNFQLEASVGGGAIDLTGTQANFGTETMILPLSRQWTVYDHIELDWSTPLKMAADTECIIKIDPATGIQAIVNAGGFIY